MKRIELCEPFCTILDTRVKKPTKNQLVRPVIPTEISLPALEPRIFEWEKVCYPRWYSVETKVEDGEEVDHGFYHNVILWVFAEQGPFVKTSTYHVLERDNEGHRNNQ